MDSQKRNQLEFIQKYFFLPIAPSSVVINPRTTNLRIIKIELVLERVAQPNSS